MKKSRKMRLVGNVAHMGQMRKAYKFWSENMKGRKHSENLGTDGGTILK
jgi:hypothetical protein